MGLLKKAHAAGNGEGDAAQGHFHLHFHALKVGAVEHGDLIELDAFLLQFENALADEGCLHVRVLHGNECGFHVGSHPRGLEVFVKAFGVGTDRFVGEIKNFRHTAVVGLDGKGAAFLTLERKGQNVLHVGTAP